MKCKRCNHEKKEHYEACNGKLYPSKCDFINCKCKKFVEQEK